MALGAAKDVVKFGVAYAGGTAAGGLAEGLAAWASIMMGPVNLNKPDVLMLDAGWAVTAIVELSGGLLVINYVGDRMNGVNQLAFTVGVLQQMKTTQALGSALSSWIISKV